MRIMTMVGIILIVLGVFGLIYGGITYTSSRNAISTGDMHIQVDDTKHIPLSSIAGAVAVLAGVVMIVFDRRRKTHG